MECRMKFNIYKVSSDYGVSVKGARFAPNKLVNKLNNDNINFVKEINLIKNAKKEYEIDNKEKNKKLVNKVNRKLYKEVYKGLKRNIFPITIGGDHSISIGSALASIKRYKNMGIIWFDTHGDFNDLKTTNSGNIHGMPFAVITGFMGKELNEFHIGEYYDPKKAVLFGAHDIDEPGEMENLKKSGVTIITAEDIRKNGVSEMIDKAFKIASNKTNGIHISFDIDGIDPSYCPGVTTAVSDGVTLDDAMKFIDAVVEKRSIIKSFDLVEFNPLRDLERKTENVAINILNNIINERK